MDGELDELRPTDEATRLIRELAERQHGVVARRQLLELGLGKGLIQKRLDGRRLVPVHRGVYAVGHRRPDLAHRWMAAVLACGRAAVLSHGSAAHLWSLRGSRGVPEVTRASSGSTLRGIRVHQAELPAEEGTVENDIPVTSIERTLLDMAADLDSRQLEHALVAADRSGRLSWPRLDRVIAIGGRMGTARLRQVAGRVDPRARDTLSPLEVDFLALCRDAGLPAPHVNVLIEGHLVDFLWAAERVIVETDSYTYHGDRLAFERDHETTVALTAAGYEVLRTTNRMLSDDPLPFLDLVRRSLSA
jgi:very-short-patch-repair endonuclease